MRTILPQNANTFTVCEDQPNLDNWGVEIRRFPTLEKAKNYVARKYCAAERNGGCESCQPFIRCDATGDRFGGNVRSRDRPQATSQSE